MKQRGTAIITVIFWVCGFITGIQGQESAKPWTWWFWPGAAVTEDGIRSQLISFQKSGFGGVSINSIYAAKDTTHPAIPFMSSRWQQMISFAIKTADSLGMQVDLSQVSGWPFGGPTVAPADAAKKIQGSVLGPFNGGIPIERKIFSPDTIQVLSVTAVPLQEETVAVISFTGNSKDDETGRTRGTAVQVREQIDQNGILRVKLPEGRWKIYVLYLKPTGQKVKRAGPGGEGLVLDPFKRQAVERYADGFDSALKTFASQGLRAVFNDSYEVYGADGTPDILGEFRTRRGYALEDYPDIFLGPSNDPETKKIIADYRQTMAELLKEKFLAAWNARSHANGLKTREQAHGSPANILDLYAAADIPETESFGSSNFNIPGIRTDPDYSPATFGRPDPVVMKFASSAAHLSGKRLVSAESSTWIANHFKVALSQIKPQIDELFTAGINQVMLASSCYSPPGVPWPGWIFYASADFGPNTGFYSYLPAFNDYVTACQEILQNARPDNDLLLYFPFSEVISTVGPDMGKLVTFDVHHPEKWLYPFDYGKLARQLLDSGYAFDFISDEQICSLQPSEKRTILIPDCGRMPEATVRALEKLASGGTPVIHHQPSSGQATSGLCASLDKAGAKSEPFGTNGLRYIRLNKGGETIYFVANLGANFHQDWLRPGAPGRNVTRIDPLTCKAVNLPRDNAGRIFLKLEPGQSCFIRINDSVPSLPAIQSQGIPSGEMKIQGPWKLTFSEGGPVIPKPVAKAETGTWTALPDTLCRWFSGIGTYETDFRLEEVKGQYLLNLGEVRDAAEVWINGKYLGRMWSVPFTITVDAGMLKKGKNHIRISVTNCPANRISWMDRNRIPWKNFFFVDILYKDFSAAGWKPEPSGLLGPVRVSWQVASGS